ncbi:hypothetical protein V7124_13460 [Neobacillus niacini]|uniref:hypothetical protein n=1 Tax=Neobacillus niacini TaxID=86668 RepID=UPI002FFF4AB4
MLAFNYINKNGKLSDEDCFILYLYHELVNQNKGISKVDEDVYKEMFFFESLIKEYNQNRSNLGLRNFLNDWVKKNHGAYLDFMTNFIDKYPSKPVHWGDRVKSIYFNTKLEQGHQFEVYIDNQFKKMGLEIGLYYAKHEQYDKGESEKGLEIKFDNMWEKTGNIYIEYQEKVHKDSQNWVNSGILKADNTIYYLIGTRKKIWILRKSDLLDIFKNWLNDPTKKWNFKQIGTSKGFVIPITEADKITLTIAEVISEIKKKSRV